MDLGKETVFRLLEEEKAEHPAAVGKAEELHGQAVAWQACSEVGAKPNPPGQPFPWDKKES